MASVAVTGLDTSLGRHVATALAARAIDVVDLDRVAEPKRGLEGVDAVAHLAWVEPDRDGGPAAESANLDRTRTILEAAGGAGVGHVVFVSSATVYGAWPDNALPITEDAPVRPNPGFAFGVQKAEAERLLGEWRDDHPGASVCILRTAVLAGDGQLSALGHELVGTKGIQVRGDGRPVQVLHERDLASAVALAVADQLDGVYNVAPDGWIVGDMAEALAGSPSRLALPGRVARPLRAAFRLLGFGRDWPEVAAYRQHPWAVANDRLRAAGWAPASSNEEAFVTGQPGSRWQNLNPRRKQELTLAASGVVILGALAAAVAAVRRRSRAA